MEIEKNTIEESNLIGIHSQKKGRFIIQEIEEENNKVFFSQKRYSFDSKKIIFSYCTYDNNVNFQSQTDNNYNTNSIYNNVPKLKSNNDLNEMEKRSTIGSFNSRKECLNNLRDSNSYFNINNNNNNNREFNLTKRKTSEENYFSSENNNVYNHTPIQIKTFVLGIEEENYDFIDFDLIWNQFIERNKINLYNDLDKRIFSYDKPCQEKIPIIPTKKSSSFFSSDQRSHKSSDPQNQKIEKQISLSSFKRYSRYNSEIKSLTNKTQNISKNLLHKSQNFERDEKRALSGERMSIFKRNSMNTFCSSFSKKMKNLNNVYNININTQSEKEKRSSILKTAFPNKNILALHSNFKSDLEINYGSKENENTESNIINIENKKLPLKKLTEKEIIQTIPVINKTETESFKGKVLENFQIEGKSKSKETECEVNIDIISSEMDSDSKKTENKNDEENKSNKKSYFYQLENENKENSSNEEFCDENENDQLFKFHSHGNNLDPDKRIYIEDDFDERRLKPRFNMEVNNHNSISNIALKEEQESDLLIPKINFDSDKNIVSDVNPFIKIDKRGISDFVYSNMNNKKAYSNNIETQEFKRKEKIFEKELNDINERNAKKRFLTNEGNYSNNNLEDLLNSPIKTLHKKDNQANLNYKKYKSRNLNLDMKSIENPYQQSSKRRLNPHNRESFELSNQTNKLDNFALEEEEDHFYFSCSSINTPKSKPIGAKMNKQGNKLTEPFKARDKPKIIDEAAAQKIFASKKFKTLKIKFNDSAHKGKQNKRISSAKKFTNTISKYEHNSKLNNKIIFDANKKFKNSNNAKMNIIKSIQKSFMEDEREKIGMVISRINSADRKFNCVKLKKTEIENMQLEILPCEIKPNENHKNKQTEEEEEEEESDPYENLQVIQVISIELGGERKKFLAEFNNDSSKDYFCKECKCKQG